MDERRSKNCHGYKVKWRGYPLSEAKWLSVNELGNCKVVLDLWIKRKRIKNFVPVFDVNYSEKYIDQFGLRDVKKPATDNSNCLRPNCS